MHGIVNRNGAWLVGLAALVAAGCQTKDKNQGKDAGIAPEVEGVDTVASVGEFSFFVTSLKFIKSKAPCTGTDGKTCLGGFGGDLRNGQANGIDGADSLCAEAARLAHPGDKHVWRAFLSAAQYQGQVLNAIDRIGSGPWYSAPPASLKKTNYASEGLLVAKDRAGLLSRRPAGDGTTVVYNGVNQSVGTGDPEAWPFSECLTNEYGTCVQADGDTQDILTGSRTDGTYAGSLAATCEDWTNKNTGYGAVAFGHAWPAQLGATDGTAHWWNTGEAGDVSCGAVINVSPTNYTAGSGGGGGLLPGLDGGFGPGGMMPDFGDGGFPPMPMTDGGMMIPLDFPDGGAFPPIPNTGLDPFFGDGGGLGIGGPLGPGTDESTYAGGVGSSGGYGAFYCFAYITGAE